MGKSRGTAKVAGDSIASADRRIAVLDLVGIDDRAWLNAAALTLAGGGRWSIDGLHA